MKITNITNTSIKPSVVSIMVSIKGFDKRFDLQPGESIYSNGDFNSLFNKSLRVQKQKGLINVFDENDLIQMEKERIEEEELILLKKKKDEELELLKESLRKQEEEEKLAAANMKKSAFDSSDFFEEPKILHPDILIVETKKEIDYSQNIIQENEEENVEKKKRGRPFVKKNK